MKQHIIFGLFVLFLGISCTRDPETILEEAKSKITESAGFNFEQIAYYPNPIGEIDTIVTAAAFHKNAKSITGYDFVVKNKFCDAINIDGVYRSVSHRDQSVELYPNHEPDKVKPAIVNASGFKYSPITLLDQTDWQYVKDTLINDLQYADFFRVEQDKVLDGNKVYTEQHIFINPYSKLMQRWERRNYYMGSLSQKVVYTYSDYQFKEQPDQLVYEYPPGYKSVFYGQSNDRELLKEGQEAPLFANADLEDNPWQLKDYRGKKMLLNFSSVGCGYCHQAVKQMNREDFQLPKHISTVYIAPFDEERSVQDYFDTMKVSYPVLPNAKEIGEVYGVTSTPTFFLIDENGVIEKVVVGYDEGFMEYLKG